MLGDHRGQAQKRELAGLLAELDAAGRLDSAIASAWQERRDPFATLLRAIALATHGRREEALVAARAASVLAPSSTLVRLIAARLMWTLRRFSEAFAELDAASLAAPSPRTGASALDWKFELARRLGWYGEALAATDAAWAMDPDSTGRLKEAAELLFITRNFEGALARIRAALRREPTLTPLHFKAASLLLRLDRHDEARAEVELGIRHSSRRLQLLLDGARYLIGASSLAAADRLLEQAAAADPSSAIALSTRGELRLWAGDSDGAASFAALAIAASGDHAPGFRVRGAARVMAGQYAEALADLDRATSLDAKECEASVWRGEAMLRLGHLEEAFADVNRGGERSEDYSDYLGAQLLRLLIQARRGAFPGMPEYVVPQALDALFPGAREALDRADVDGIASLLERALAKMRGNRAYTPTWADSPSESGPVALDAVTPLRIRTSPRAPSKEALWLFTTGGREVSLAGFARVHADYPLSPEPYCYHGELYLYLGEYEEARRNFDTALSIYGQTRWAFIGLGAVELLEGRPQKALETIARGVAISRGEGPTTFVYRGEAHRRAGDLPRAIADLEHATRLNPERVSAWLNLGLALHAGGDRTTPGQIHDRLLRQAPGLMADAAREYGLPEGIAPGAPPAPDSLPDYFEHILRMKRGNRSSTCVTYFTREGVLRVVPSTLSFDESYEARELRQLRALIERSLGLNH